MEYLDSQSDLAQSLGHIQELDGVRGLAALLVFFHHLCFTSITVAGWGRLIEALSTVFHYGVVGVDIFFTLSGFLITSILLQDSQRPHYYHNFYWKRALRILPLYIVCLLGVYGFIPAARSYVILAAFFMANFAYAFHIVTAGPFWTLAIEEHFYLVWPTVVRRRSVEEIGRWALLITLGAIVLRVVAALFGHHNYAFTFFRCDGLALGAWLACRSRRPGGIAFLGCSRDRRCFVAVLSAALLMLVLASKMSTNGRGVAFGAALFQTAVVLLSASLVAVIVACQGRKWLAVFRSPILTFFGLISYAVYMIHMYVMFVYDYYMGPLQTGSLSGYWTRLLTVLGATVLIALISRYSLELPAMSLRRFVIRK